MEPVKCMKNNRLISSAASLLALLMLGLLLFACDRRKDDPGWDYFPDMAYSRAYETNSANPVLKSKQTMLAPVMGTVARNAEYFPYEKTPEDLLRAGKELANPAALTDSTLASGKYYYENMCMNCHGASGDGKGFLFTSGKYPFPPASLLAERALKRTNGELYHIITLGYGVMGAHGGQLRPAQRWDIIQYINEVIQHNDSIAKK